MSSRSMPGDRVAMERDWLRTGCASSLRRCGWLIPLVAIALTLGCARKAPLGPPLLADISDPVGDAAQDPLFATSPDLVHGTASVVDGKMTFTIRFAPGTFDPSTTRITVQLDTDQNPSTGIRTVIGLGIDYIVDMWAPMATANISKSVPGAACTATDPCYDVVGLVPLTLLSDGMVANVPLALVASREGRVNFRVNAYAMRPGVRLTAPTMVLDVMPDLALPPAHIP
jgi:hypothetical protein